MSNGKENTTQIVNLNDVMVGGDRKCLKKQNKM